MDEIAPENLLDKRYKLTATIYFALIFSSIVVVILAFFVADESRTENASALMPLWVAIIFIAIATFVLRRALTRWERLRDAKLLKGFAGLFSTLQTNSIILGALAEAIAVVGLVISILSGSKFDAARAGAVALVVFLMNFPRKSVWQKIAASLENV